MSSVPPGQNQLVAATAADNRSERPSKRQRRVAAARAQAQAVHAATPPMGPWWNPMMMGQIPPVPPRPMGLDESSESEAPVPVPKAPAAVEEDPAVAAQRQGQLNLQQVRAALFTEPTTALARDQQRINRNYATLRNLPKAWGH